MNSIKDVKAAYMITRGANFQQQPLNLVGSSVFGRYPKISIEKTYNMFESQGWMVPYAGYDIAINSVILGSSQSGVGRGIFASTKFDCLVTVVDNNVFLIKINYNQLLNKFVTTLVANIGKLATYTGVVYITENNRPQILISDNVNLYCYDPTTPTNPEFQIVTIDFVPGYITFHDNYFISATNTNQWRLSATNNGNSWPTTASSTGSLQTKPDNVQAVVRFPSKGNMIFVIGSIVTEAWFDTGAQLFPYQRNNQFNIDYGCISPATVAYMDETVVWLGKNEKSGPIILASNGGMPKKISTDGIDYLFSELQNPQDSQGFIYRQDGHIFYQINFYSDNLSLFYDFNMDKFYHCSDQNLNYFISAEVAFYQNQYYFVSKNTGNLYAFDTTFTTYTDSDVRYNTNVVYEIPRIRTCANIRLASQEYFISNDLGFTIESGETDYQKQDIGQGDFIYQNGNIIVSQGESGAGDELYLQTQDEDFLISQDGKYFGEQQLGNSDGIPFVTQQNVYIYTTPSVDMAISYDGGASFSNNFRYDLPSIGQRRNRLIWWQGGMCNDLVAKFQFNGLGRFVCTDGIVNVRT